MIKFQQKMNRIIRAKSVLGHYFSRKTVFISPIGGLLLVAIYILMERYQFQLPGHNIFILFFAALFILRPLINMLHIYFDVRIKRDTSERVITIEFDEEHIKTKDEDSEENFKLTRLHKYHISKSFIFLFSSKTQYFFIDKTQIDQNQIDYITGVLKKLTLEK